MAADFVITLETDEGLSLESVDPVEAARFLTVYLDALTEEASLHGETLRFTGLNVDKGSLKWVTRASNERIAIRNRQSLSKKIREGSGEKHVKALISARRSFATVTVGVGISEADLPNPGVRPTDAIVTELTSFRAVFVGIDAKKDGSRARFLSQLDDEELELEVDATLEKALLPCFRAAMDVSAEVRRSAESREPKVGRLLSFHPVTKGDDLQAWRDWLSPKWRGELDAYDDDSSDA